MFKRAFFFCAWALIVAAAGTGCGGGSLTKTTGTVTLDGQPLSGAMVQFIREDGKGTPATGITGTDGSFRLTTYSTGDGALPGDYKVLVTMPAEDSGPAAGQTPMDPQERMEAMRKFAQDHKKADPNKARSLPASYGDAKKTPLRQRVPAEGNVEITLNSAGS
jgi:hypothetical protein